MAEFNPDKLSERLEQLNREQLATMEKLVEELLNEMEQSRPVAKRADRRVYRPKLDEASDSGQ